MEMKTVLLLLLFGTLTTRMIFYLFLVDVRLNDGVKTSNGFPLGSLKNSRISSASVLDFMKKFGYLEKDDGNAEALYTDVGISETIKTMQRFGGIEESGILDNETLMLITRPRCGVPDILRKRTKRFIIARQGGWNKRTLTYFIANWSPSLGEKAVAKNIQKALDIWGRYGRVKVQRRYTPDVDIIVAFGRGYHGDPFPFDGRGVVLAHAFFPYEDDLGAGFGGDIHFDDDELWTDGDDSGTDFFSVALHELGHSLGLSHSPVVNSVMYPYYKGGTGPGSQELGYDDILAMYHLYIQRNIPEDPTDEPPIDSTTVTTIQTTDSTSITEYENNDTTTAAYDEDITESLETTTTNYSTPPYICHANFDAVATLRDELFIFKDQYVWRLKGLGKIMPQYPVKLHTMFASLPHNITRIDAVYERPDGMIVLFTGKQFWVYDGKQIVSNSPLTWYGLPNYLDKIDAVQLWAKNGKTYFYRLDRFWRYNETSGSMDSGYPKHMERWRGVPENLDSATTWKGVTYFFKGQLYWKFDNDWVITTEESPFPVAPIWLGCSEDDITLNMESL